MKSKEQSTPSHEDDMTAQILSLLLYMAGSLCFVAGSAVLLWKALS
jgi:hypothetical protein